MDGIPVVKDPQPLIPSGLSSAGSRRRYYRCHGRAGADRPARSKKACASSQVAKSLQSRSLAGAACDDPDGVRRSPRRQFQGGVKIAARMPAPFSRAA